jgi:chromosome segregation ATPase
MLEINEALEKDLEREKKKTTMVEQERGLLQEQAQRMERELASLDDLRAEIGDLGQERVRLAAIIEEAGRQAVEAEHENRKLERLAERMRAERDDALEEVQSLEAQFDHAMEMVADLKTRVATFAEEREALAGRLKVIEAQLGAVEDQRDALKSEVDESRRALDEIRRQVADACVSSQRYYYQQLEEKE